MTQHLAFPNEEPTIAELLNDPIAHLLMKRDGVCVRDVVAVIEAARDRRRAAVERFKPGAFVRSAA